MALYTVKYAAICRLEDKDKAMNNSNSNNNNRVTFITLFENVGRHEYLSYAAFPMFSSLCAAVSCWLSRCQEKDAKQILPH